MKDPFEISRQESPSQVESLNTIYGHIIDIFTTGEDDYYVPLVTLESSSFPAETNIAFVPLDESNEQLAATYGSPRDIIGLRVRIEYRGIQWMSGIARIAPEKDRVPVGNATSIPSRGFRYAVAGGGKV